MRYMNDHDIDCAVVRFTRAGKPNRLGLALVVSHLADWANNNSDGWHSWPKPCRAAARAIELIESTTWDANERQEDNDITQAEVDAAVRPIKAFLTRQRVDTDTRERILRGAQPI